MSRQDPIQIEVTDSLPPDVLSTISAGLGAYNDAAAPLHQVRALACVAKDEAGEVIAGLLGRTWGECCEIQELWVREDRRGRGIGTRLVREFEASAKQRGCRLSYLETLSFQAPRFYLALGYEIGLRLAGFPQGIEKFVMTRRL